MSAADTTTTGAGQGTALVTGATSGIGRATALRLARDGWEVVVHGRNAERGAEVVGEIEGQGGRARFVAADLNDVAAVRSLVAEIGAVDVLVNNAGASWFGPTADLDEATFDGLFDGNVRAAYFLVAVSPRAWPNGGRGASSAWPAWPARSAWPAGRRTGPPRRPSAR